MKLPIKTEIKGTPTLFIEKIFSSLIIDLNLGNEVSQCIERVCYFLKVNPDNYVLEIYQNPTPKRHAIIKDKRCRWRGSSTINFFFLKGWRKCTFFPELTIVSTQLIVITKYEKGLPLVFIDNVQQDFKSVRVIAKNDGFDSPYDFFAFYGDTYQGKIIHWTDLKY